MLQKNESADLLAEPVTKGQAASGFQRTGHLTIGDVVAHTYRLLRRVGRGGMSEVFAVEHLRLGRVFALKLLRSELHDGEGAAERFRREARALANLKSEFVVQVVDCGEHDDGRPYLVMELLEGCDLRSVLKQQRILPISRAVALMLEVCRGLAQAHMAGLVHRDLKPENLFVTQRESGEDWCKILDFGIAKMESSQATIEGTVVGTVRYMAPEQLADGSNVDVTTDVYAVGAILYECLSGQPLHQGATVEEVMFRVMNQQPVALASLCPELPVELCELVSRATAKRQCDRPQSIDALALLLSGACRAPATDNPTVAEGRRSTAHSSAPRTSGRRAGLALVACAGLLGAWFGGRWSNLGRIEAAATARPVEAALPNPPDAPRPAPPKVQRRADVSAAISASQAPSSPVPRPNARAGVRQTVAKPQLAPSASVLSLPAGGQFDAANPYAK